MPARWPAWALHTGAAAFTAGQLWPAVCACRQCRLPHMLQCGPDASAACLVAALVAPRSLPGAHPGRGDLPQVGCAGLRPRGSLLHMLLFLHAGLRACRRHHLHLRSAAVPHQPHAWPDARPVTWHERAHRISEPGAGPLSSARKGHPTTPAAPGTHTCSCNPSSMRSEEALSCRGGSEGQG